jgi:hypothetical protein
MSVALQELLVAAGMFGLMMAGLEVGYRFGRRRFEQDANARASSAVSAVQGAILGLLGLLLAFSFAAAATRFLERQDLIVAEANAIGTAALRAELLDEPYHVGLYSALTHYTERRLEMSARLRVGILPDDLAEIERLHGRIWSTARAGVLAKPVAMLAVLGPVNELIDLHATRMAASRKHLPIPVLSLLLACSALAIAVTGYGSGIGDNRRSPLGFALALLITVALLITIDLDYPRMGLLQLSDAPLQELRFDGMATAPAPAPDS